MKKFLLTALAALSAFSHLNACTGIKLTAKDSSVIHGRTWEFGRELDASIVVIPREMAFTGTTPLGPGLSYLSKYGALGMIAFNQPAILDGINEAGLSVGTFHFQSYATYADVLPENQCLAVSPIEFPHWILTQFATIEEVRAGLNSILIASTPLREWGQAPPSFHYIVFDKKGKSLVIEPVQGRLAVYENKLGVLTNAPGFNWHVNFLRQHAPWICPSVKWNAFEITPVALGAEIHFPGDLTASSRFVRAALFSTQIKPMATSDETVLQAFHVLNQFDIPFGIIQDEKKQLIGEYTSMMSVRDPQSLKYYFKTHIDPAIRMIDLNQFDLNETTIKRLCISNTDQPIADISSELE